MTPDVEITADLSDRWRYWRWMTAVAVVLGSPISVAANIVEFPQFSIARTFAFALVLVAGLSSYAGFYSLVCIRRQGRVTYSIGSGLVQVRRGDQVIFTCAACDVRSLEMDGYVPDSFRWTSLSLSYDWPHLVLELDDRSRPKHLPSIMLWGRTAVDTAERELRHAVDTR